MVKRFGHLHQRGVLEEVIVVYGQCLGYKMGCNSDGTIRSWGYGSFEKEAFVYAVS